MTTGAGFTRREALIVGGVAAGALLAPGVPRAAAAPPVLSQRRSAAFRSFVAALNDAPDGRFDTWEPRRAAKALARWYATQSRANRAHADAVLDGLAARRGALRYARLARADSAFVAAAVSLATIVCEPPPAEDEHPPILGVAT